MFREAFSARVSARALTGVFCLFLALSVHAGQRSLQGMVTDRSNHPVSNITLTCGTLTTKTNAEGRYTFPQFPEGTQTLILTFANEEVAHVTIDPERLQKNIRVGNILNKEVSLVVVSSRNEHLSGEVTAETQLARMPASVTGELLRQMPGIEAVRRGPVGLDPVVRGLRETEVGAYLDGTRLFPAGPGRMDSALSHLDPSMIERITLVKGPYALTWGGGNMSAIRADSFNTRRLTSGSFGGSLFTGYRENTEGYHVSPSVYGRSGRVGYWAQAAIREGDDYQDGNGTDVPASLTSREARAKVDFELTALSNLQISAGYQEQEDIDYPGRLLNAEFFETENFALTYNRAFEGGSLTNLQAQAYYNGVDHGMNNDGKPTAQPNPNRMPPFALAINVNSDIAVSGARLALEANVGSWKWTFGGDYYHTERNALRSIARAETGMVMMQDAMWPDATLDNGGLFVSGETLAGSGMLTAGLRLDRVKAYARNLSDFYMANVGTEVDDSTSELSGSLTYNYNLNQTWSLSLGAGSVSRPADANERFSDRIPNSKSQISAEFVGNPFLENERSNQVDIWLEGSGEAWDFSLNTFAREISNFITIEETDLPKRMPLSPDTVYRYVNGDARFHGAEATLGYAFSENWRTRLQAEYLYGEDTELDEPAFGVTPFKASLWLTYTANFGELSLNVEDIAEQDRVGTTRGESATEAYTLLHLRTHWNVWKDLGLSIGVNNLTDEAYTHHLNARNPFTKQRINEPGRSFFADLRYKF